METATPMRLFVDMDGTLARFHDQANYLERMFEKDFFRDLEPFENMVAGIRQFIWEHPEVEVYILSARVNGEPPFCEVEKNAWLDEFLPDIDREHRIFTEMGKPKAEFIPGGVTKQDFLLDDYNKGLNQWLFDGGSAIKCHNNINQRGLGAYGGSAGMLWTGNMVHTEDTPELISAELAQHMGLSFDLEKVAASYEHVHYTEYEPGDMVKPVPIETEPSGAYLTKFNAGSYDGVSISHTLFSALHWDEQDASSFHFENPLNAVRWLHGQKDFVELKLRDAEGNSFVLPKFKADALAANLFGCSMAELRDNIQGTYPLDVVTEMQSGLSEADEPVIGCINYLGSNGRVGESCIFRSVADMEQEIQESRDCGRPFTEEWFVQRKEPESGITLNTYPDLGIPSSFTLSVDNLFMAATTCGIKYDSLERFLSEYTWDDSLRIWADYAQYIDKLAGVMDGFASRKEVEEEFFDVMCEPDMTPLAAAKLIAANMDDWAVRNNERGVLEKSSALRIALDNVHKPPKQTGKSSLDSMIFSAKNHQGGPSVTSSGRNPER